MALSWFPRVLFSSVLRLDAVVMRQSPPVAFVVASGASGDDVETCNLPMNLQFVDGGSDGSSLGAELLHTVPRLSGEVEVFPKACRLRHHLGSARVSERDEKEETTDVVLLF